MSGIAKMERNRLRSSEFETFVLACLFCPLYRCLYLIFQSLYVEPHAKNELKDIREVGLEFKEKKDIYDVIRWFY